MDEIDALINDLSSEDRIKRCDAIWALMNIGKDAGIAVPPIRQLLDDHSEPFICLIAAGAIICIVGDDEQAISILIEAVESEDSVMQALACKFLGHSRDPSVLPSLFSLLSDESLLHSAAQAIGMVSGDWSYLIDVSLKSLGDFDDQIMQGLARESLLMLGKEDKAIVSLLVERLSSLHWEVRLELEEILHILKTE